MTYKDERVAKLKDAILQYVDKNDKFPIFQELKNNYKKETNTVIYLYGSYDDYLKEFSLYDLKVKYEKRQYEEEIEVLEDLALKLKRNMLNKGEVKEKYPEHYKILSKHYHNRKGGYSQFLKDYGLEDDYKLMLSPIQSMSEEERKRHYNNQILKIIKPVSTKDKVLTVNLTDIKSYRVLQYYSNLLGKTAKQAIRDLGYMMIDDLMYIDKEKYYNEKIIELLEPIVDENKEINEHLSKLDCFPSLYYFSKKMGKTAEQAIKDLGYKPL